MPSHLPTSPSVPGSGPETLRRLFRRHAAGIAVVTTREGDRPVGLLVTSLVSVSSVPPLVSFNVALTSSSWPALSAAEHVGVHLLGEHQTEIADRFARKGADRFAPPTSWRAGEHDVPLIDGVVARSVAVVEERFDVADHVIVVARLLGAEVDDATAPLIYHDGAYHRARPAFADEVRRTG